MKRLIAFVLILGIFFLFDLARAGLAEAVEASKGEELSKDFAGQNWGRNVPVYGAKVASADRSLRFNDFVKNMAFSP